MVLSRWRSFAKTRPRHRPGALTQPQKSVEPILVNHRDTMNTEQQRRNQSGARPSGRRSERRAGQFGTCGCSRGSLRRERRAPLSLRPRRPVPQPCKILARREDFSRSAAVCAEHQPQHVGRTGCLGFHRMSARIRGRCGWSSADTAALLGLRLRRSVFIVSLWSIAIVPAE